MHVFASGYMKSSLELYWLPIRVEYAQGEITERFPIFPPHELFALLAESGQETFGKCCLPPEGACALGTYLPNHARPRLPKMSKLPI